MALIDETILTFEQRLKELQPYLDEAEELQRAIAQLKGEKPETQKFEGRRTTEFRKRQILDLLGEQPMRVTDLASELDLTVSRIVQIVNELEAENRVERSPEGLRVKQL